MKLNLPKIIKADDYHEFNDARYYLKAVIPGVKVKEVGFNGAYCAIVYVGSLTDADNDRLFKATKKSCDNFDAVLSSSTTR